jgi:cytochrome P450
MIVLYVKTNPRVYSSVLFELSSATISNPIKVSEACKLPYLQAVIREGLRICPPAIGLGFREVPEGGDAIFGYHAPAHTKIGFNFFGLVDDPKL